MLDETMPTGQDREEHTGWATEKNAVDASNFRGAVNSIIDVAVKDIPRQSGHQEASAPRYSLPERDAYPDLSVQWTSAALSRVIEQQRQYYRYGMYGIKRDVARPLDPLHRHLLTEQRAKELFNA